jgi:hypothetical protein
MVADGGPTEKDLESLKAETAHLSESTVCAKEELDWSESSYVASLPRIAWSLFRGR